MVETGPSEDLWNALAWRPDHDQLKQFNDLQTLLREWNERVNLTRLVDGEDYWVNQVFDSLWPLKPELSNPQQELVCIDVGTGGGFPGLAVAIALPQSRLTLVDSVGRKTAAVSAMSRSLGIDHRVTVLNERIEETGRQAKTRGRFDLAVARAVAAAPVVAEYLVPLLNPEGEALLYRGQWNTTDTANLNRALQPLKAQISRHQSCELPADRGIRNVLRLRPIAVCPATYPRAVGIPNRQPLGSG